MFICRGPELQKKSRMCMLQMVKDRMASSFIEGILLGYNRLVLFFSTNFCTPNHLFDDTREKPEFSFLQVQCQLRYSDFIWEQMGLHENCN